MIITPKNASSWPSISLGDRICFSPNASILTTIPEHPTQAFWSQTDNEFACVIVNQQQQTIELVRDHFGLEPLFYCIYHEQFIFGGSIADIIKTLGFTPKINEAQVTQTLLNACGGRGDYSDETNVQLIYRVEPGCIVSFIDGKMRKTYYWQLNCDREPIYYNNPKDYVDHFSELLTEGIKTQTAGSNKIAAEFSGGLDSSTVICGLHQLNKTPALFMHVAPDASDEVDDSPYAESVIQHLNLTSVHYIGAEAFDLLEVARQCVKTLGTSPQYLFPIGASPIHQAVAQEGCDILLSGFGGDECISGHAPLKQCLQELRLSGGLGKAWNELRAYYAFNKQEMPSALRRLGSFILHLYPQFRPSNNVLGKLLGTESKSTLMCPSYLSAKNIREYEQYLLQGRGSHHVRLRIEESAIIAKQLGFKYRYPLLYPKLVEFCHRLPISLKRKDGCNRMIVREYLAQHLPAMVYQKHQKIGGIMPATVHKMKEEYWQGAYKEAFTQLPFEQQAADLRKEHSSSFHSQLLHEVFLFGLKINESIETGP